MKTPKVINIANGIAPTQLIQLIKKYPDLQLKGKEKTIEIATNKIVIFQNQQLTLENIPSEINGLEISDVQKMLLLKGHSVLVGDQSISINKENTGLRIQRNDGQRQLKIS